MIAVKIFTRSPVGNPNIPDLPAKANGLPFQLTEVKRLTGGDSNIRFDEFAEHAVGKSMKRIGSRPNIWNRKFSAFITAHPKLIIFSVLLPIDIRSIAHFIIRMSK